MIIKLLTSFLFGGEKLRTKFHLSRLKKERELLPREDTEFDTTSYVAIKGIYDYPWNLVRAHVPGASSQGIPETPVVTTDDTLYTYLLYHINFILAYIRNIHLGGLVSPSVIIRYSVLKVWFVGLHLR